VNQTNRVLQTEQIKRAHKDDTVDAALLATPLGERGLRERLIFYEPFHVYAARRHPLLKKKAVRQSDLFGNDVWLVEDGHCIRNQVVNFCTIGPGGRAYDNVSFESGDLETLRGLIKRGSGYTLLPDLLVRQMGNRERREHVRPFVHPVPTREISLVFRRDIYKGDVQRALYDSIREALPRELMEGGKRRRQILPVASVA
jgi:LysR family hydrogen peroxide-inducible transcriptional activator